MIVKRKEFKKSRNQEFRKLASPIPESFNARFLDRGTSKRLKVEWNTPCLHLGCLTSESFVFLDS
jgi:hypothetical protein